MSSLSENVPQASSSFNLAPSSTIVSATISAPSTSQFSNNVKPVAAEEMLKTLKTCFPGLALHSSYNCQNKCMNLSPSELRSQKQLKFKFNYNWLFADFTYCKQTGIHWLVFSEQNHGMFCILCNKHATQNLSNKSKTYSSEPATRFRKLALEEHASSEQHHAATTAEMLSQVSVFHQEREKVLSSVFRACYFLAKHKISNRKLIPFLEFLKQVGLNDIQYYRHHSEYSVREVFLTIGMTIKEMILENVRVAGIYGLFANDATDVAVVEQMVAFVSYINTSTSRQEVKFLFIEDVLNDPEADSATADVLL